MKKSKKKIYLILAFSFIIVIGLVSLVIFFTSKTGGEDSKKEKMSVSIEIETKNKDKTDTHFINFKDDKEGLVANVDYLGSKLYVQKGVIYITKGGRYQKIKRDYTYADLYDLLYRLDFAKENGGYNPKIEMDTMNDILSALLIDSEVQKDVYANITFKDGMIRRFSIYLSNSSSFEQLDISIDFSSLDEDFKNGIPKFYDEATDEVEDELVLLKS